MPVPIDIDNADVLTGDLRVVLKAGLPVRVQMCGQDLLRLHGVRARALEPSEPASCIQALDALLREQLDRLENAELGPAARLLFGAEQATSGATLMQRRAAAAAVAGYEVHHFRKRIEPKLLAVLAWQLRRDSERFTAVHAEPPELRLAGGRLNLPADVFAWEAAEHQQAIAHLWGCIYALRAELLRVARMVSMDAGADRLRAAADLALWRHAQLLSAAGHYRSAYGPLLLHAESPLRPHEVAAFAGWTPPLGPADQQLLIDCVDPTASAEDFTARMSAAGGDGRAAAWCWDLTARQNATGTHDTMEGRPA